MGDMLKKAYDDSMLDCPEKPKESKLKYSDHIADVSKMVEHKE